MTPHRTSPPPPKKQQSIKSSIFNSVFFSGITATCCYSLILFPASLILTIATGGFVGLIYLGTITYFALKKSKESETYPKTKKIIWGIEEASIISFVVVSVICIFATIGATAGFVGLALCAAMVLICTIYSAKKKNPKTQNKLGTDNTEAIPPQKIHKSKQPTNPNNTTVKKTTTSQQKKSTIADLSIFSGTAPMASTPLKRIAQMLDAIIEINPPISEFINWNYEDLQSSMNSLKCHFKKVEGEEVGQHVTSIIDNFQKACQTCEKDHVDKLQLISEKVLNKLSITQGELVKDQLKRDLIKTVTQSINVLKSETLFSDISTTPSPL